MRLKLKNFKKPEIMRSKDMQKCGNEYATVK